MHPGIVSHPTPYIYIYVYVSHMNHMYRNVSHPIGLLQEGCAALANLSHDPDGTAEAASGGGALYVAVAMAAHIDDERLQRYGVAVLDNLGATSKHDEQDRLGSAKPVSSSGAQQVHLSAPARVCAAMAAHPNSAELIELGCRAISNIAQESATSRRTVTELKV